MNPQYWTTDEAYKAGYEDGRKEAEDRLIALQRVADAAKALLGPYAVNVGRTHGKSELLNALRALEE